MFVKSTGKIGQMTKEEFQTSIFKFLAEYPQGVPKAVDYLATECQVGRLIVWGWARGEYCPHQKVREWVASWTK
jgi:hypothetical protein